LTCHNGIWRWFNRVWNLVLRESKFDLPQMGMDIEKELRYQTHRTIKKVTGDLNEFRFNTMIAALMEFTNHLMKVKETCAVGNPVWKEAIDSLVLLLAPSAPHLAEELWCKIGRSYSVHNQTFPCWEEELVVEDQITLVIQVNGKLRDKISVPTSIVESEACELALGREKVRAYTENKKIENIVYVPGRLVNVVVR